MATALPNIGKSPFDASASAVGYLFQILSALHLAVKRDDSADVLSLEMIDDVAFSPADASSAKPAELLQFKHSLTRKATLTDKSVDLWKSLRVWSELITAGSVDPQRTIFTLVSTAAASSPSSLCLLRHKDRDSEKARKDIEKAGSESSNSKVKECLTSLKSLKVSDRKALFGNMYVLDAAPDALDTRRLIEHELRYLVDDPPRQLAGFTDRLVGWWERTVIDHLVSDPKSPLPVGLVQRQVRDLREQFKRESLPDDFLDAIVPEDQTVAVDDRCFVRQLRLIHATQQQIRLAQENHYRAYEQRSRWIRENLLGLGEVGTYETRLFKEWENKLSIALDGFSSAATDGEKVTLGKGLYHWTQETAVGMAGLFIRPQFQSGYMVRGSFHMLADVTRLGWHPDFLALLGVVQAQEAANA